MIDWVAYETEDLILLMDDIEMLQIAFLANAMGICVGESEIVHNVYDQHRRYSLFLVTILDDC